MNLIIKLGRKLTKDEIVQINTAKKREFQALPLSKEQLQIDLHFLLKDKEKIVAMGCLIPIGQVIFDNELFSPMGIGGIIANLKGKGHGKIIMTAIKNHLLRIRKTGVGFCLYKNKGFYQKCGFKVNDDVIKRFVYYDNDKKITDTEDHCVFYTDSIDRFMEKVLSNKNLDIVLNRTPNW